MVQHCHTVHLALGAPLSPCTMCGTGSGNYGLLGVSPADIDAIGAAILKMKVEPPRPMPPPPLPALPTTPPPLCGHSASS